MSTPEDLHTIRKKYPKRLTRGRAIRLYCKENCCAGDMKSWQECSQPDCFLFNFRRGKEILEEEEIVRKKSSILSKNKENEGGNATN